MTSKFWVKSYKFSSVVGMTLGLLMPGLSLLAVTPFSALAWELPPQPTPPSECSGAGLADYFITETYFISIFTCENVDNYFFVATKISDQSEIKSTKVTIEADRTYLAITSDEEGNEIAYKVGGDQLTLFKNGKQLWYEEASKP